MKKAASVLRWLLAASLLLLELGGRSFAQDACRDTLRLDVYFSRGSTEIDPDFHDNGARMRAFRELLEERLRDGCTLGSILLRGSASPEGASSENKTIASLRAHALDVWLAETPGLHPELYYREVGEDWEGLARIVRTLDIPWRDAALDIIGPAPGQVQEDRLRRLADGEAWRWLDANVFPELRSAGVSVTCIDKRPAPRDTVILTQTVRDTVYVEVVPPAPQEPGPAGPDFSDRRMLFALRTNFLAIPLMNLGVEVPLGRRWSVGADIYYPWLGPSGHVGGVDKTGVCNEFSALDVEVRYWFPRRDMQDGQRLLGHSVGLYGAAGYYDFERDWSGHQGEFFNVGLDYLYAAPIFRGRMHLEAELGLGYIWSTARPYDCFEPGGKIYHRKGVTKNTTWVGPTRVQLSLVFPIYARRKGGER